MLAANRTSPRPLAIMAAVAVAGAALGLGLAAANDADSIWPATIVLGFGGFVVGAAVVGGWAGSRPFQLRRQVPLAADAIRDHAER